MFDIICMYWFLLTDFCWHIISLIKHRSLLIEIIFFSDIDYERCLPCHCFAPKKENDNMLSRAEWTEVANAGACCIVLQRQSFAFSFASVLCFFCLFFLSDDRCSCSLQSIFLRRTKLTSLYLYTCKWYIYIFFFSFPSAPEIPKPGCKSKPLPGTAFDRDVYGYGTWKNPMTKADTAAELAWENPMTGDQPGEPNLEKFYEKVRSRRVFERHFFFLFFLKNLFIFFSLSFPLYSTRVSLLYFKFLLFANRWKRLTWERKVLDQAKMIQFMFKEKKWQH